MKIKNCFFVFLATVIMPQMAQDSPEKKEGAAAKATLTAEEKLRANLALYRTAMRSYKNFPPPHARALRYEAIKKAIENGANINAKFNRKTLLRTAAQNGDLELFNILLQFPQLNKQEIIEGIILDEFIQVADEPSEKTRENILSVLIDHGFDMKKLKHDVFVHDAVAHANLNWAQTLITHGAAIPDQVFFVIFSDGLREKIKNEILTADQIIDFIQYLLKKLPDPVSTLSLLFVPDTYSEFREIVKRPVPILKFIQITRDYLLREYDYQSSIGNREPARLYRKLALVYRDIQEELENYLKIHASTRVHEIAQALESAEQGGAAAAAQGRVHMPSELQNIIFAYMLGQQAPAPLPGRATAARAIPKSKEW